MQMRPLGTTGTQVSALGFGCMGLIGWYGMRDDAEASATLHAAIEAGVTHFDTASSYQNGASEQFVGQMLAPHLQRARSRLFIASKYGILRDPQGGVLIDNRPESLRAAVDASLARLGVDYIDLYYLHRIDPQVAIEESVSALAQLVQAGKLRHIGLSECSAATLRRAHAVHPIAAVQNEYSLWVRDPESSVLAACRELGVALVACSPLGRGFLAGAFRNSADLPAGDARRVQPRFKDDASVHNLRIVDALREFAQIKSCSVAQLAIAWLLHQGNDVLPIPGTKQRGRLAENLAALQVQLSAAECAQLGALVAQLGVIGERHPPAMMKVLNG